MKALALLSLPFAILTSACLVGDPNGGGGGDDGTTNPTGEVSGSITGNQTWSDKITITANATIESGATVTVDAGTAIEAKAGVTLRVKGTLRIAGTAAAKVSMLPVTGAVSWAGIVADSGGRIDLAYAEGTAVATLVYCHAGATCNIDHAEFSGMGQAVAVDGIATITHSRLSDMINGGVTIGTGDLTITDSFILGSEGDIIVQNGGKLTIDHTEIGEATGQNDHCVFHVNAATKLQITRSVIRDGVYGMMLGGTSGAVMQYNNWTGNDPQKDVSLIGTNTAVDLRYNYWSNGAPTALGAGYDVSMAAGATISDAGPRP